LAAAGSKAKIQIWDVGANFGARKAFSAKLAQAGRALKEYAEGSGGVVGVAEDDEDNENGNDDE
jgi:periodic tryptophan protein 1